MGIVSVIDEMVSSSRVHAWAYTTAGEHGRPAKGVAIVACMDARINVESMFGLPTGDAHIIRNAGGIVTDDVLRSLLISQRLLGTREILLLHHTDCGLMRLNDSQLVPQLEREAGVNKAVRIFVAGAEVRIATEYGELLRALTLHPKGDHQRPNRR